MTRIKKMYMLFFSLLVLLQIVACAITSAPVRKQPVIWDVSGVSRIAIVPVPTIDFSDKSSSWALSSDEYTQQLESMLKVYIWSEARKMLQETGKFIIVNDSKDADAVLDCDIISIHREDGRNWTPQGADYYQEWSVVYNILLKRTSDGAIIGDCAGMGQRRKSSDRSDYVFISATDISILIHINHLKQALGIVTKK